MCWGNDCLCGDASLLLGLVGRGGAQVVLSRARALRTELSNWELRHSPFQRQSGPRLQWAQMWCGNGCPCEKSALGSLGFGGLWHGMCLSALVCRELSPPTFNPDINLSIGSVGQDSGLHRCDRRGYSRVSGFWWVVVGSVIRNRA